MTDFTSSLDVQKLQWLAAWAGVLLVGIAPMVWAVHQRFIGGVKAAMGGYSPPTRRGPRPKLRQRFIKHLEADQRSAERVRRNRSFYIVAYIVAVISPGIALGLYAIFQLYLAPGAAPALLPADMAGEGQPDASPLGTLDTFTFFLSEANFLAILTFALADDLPPLANILMQFDTEAGLVLNPQASLYSALVIGFKWVSGPALLLSGVVIAELRGGFLSISDRIARYERAIKALTDMKDELEPEVYRSAIEQIMDAPIDR